MQVPRKAYTIFVGFVKVVKKTNEIILFPFWVRLETERIPYSYGSIRARSAYPPQPGDPSPWKHT